MTTITPLATYRNDRPYPFCPGCGHGPVLDRLNEALVDVGSAPEDVVIVSDIGCSGLSDQYFATSAFHGLHGRSITYATGIKLANPELTVIVIMGDGGTGIGGTHLISAARRNIGITVLVMNNMNFGMTGGQHSTTTFENAVTSTTPGGNLEHPLDVCATVGVNGAAYVYRGTSFDEDLATHVSPRPLRIPASPCSMCGTCVRRTSYGPTSSRAGESMPPWRPTHSRPASCTGVTSSNTRRAIRRPRPRWGRGRRHDSSLSPTSTRCPYRARSCSPVPPGRR